MARFIAFLRGVSPLNCRMSRLRDVLSAAGFRRIKTVLSSGNAAFDADAKAEMDLERKLEELLRAEFGRGFFPIVRSSSWLTEFTASDPFATLPVPTDAKRIVSFLRTEASPKVALPLTEDTATIFRQIGREVLTAYTPSPNGPVFMRLLARAYGDEITTRTLDTVLKCARA
jgi:uncharacterized protein (DUF1697 family)